MGCLAKLDWLLVLLCKVGVFFLFLLIFIHPTSVRASNLRDTISSSSARFARVLVLLRGTLSELGESLGGGSLCSGFFFFWGGGL